MQEFIATINFKPIDDLCKAPEVYEVERIIGGKKQMVTLKKPKQVLVISKFDEKLGRHIVTKSQFIEKETRWEGFTKDETPLGYCFYDEIKG